MSSLAQLQELRFHPASALVHVGAALQLELRLCSLMPVPMQVQQLSASVHFALEQPGTMPHKRSGQNPAGTVTFPAASPMSSSPALELCEIQEHSPSDNTLSSAGVICKNMHLLMRRHDSATSLDTPNTAPSTVTMEDGAQMLKSNDVTLLPGNNSIIFTAPVRRVFLLGGMCFNGRLHLLRVLPLRPRRPGRILYARCGPRWAGFSFFCLIFILWCSTTCTHRSHSSPFNPSQVSPLHSSYRDTSPESCHH